MIVNPDVIEDIRSAYDEARDHGCNDQFLYGMRYVMRLLGMPEGQSLNGDKGGTRCCNGTGIADYAAVPCPNPQCPVRI